MITAKGHCDKCNIDFDLDEDNNLIHDRYRQLIYVQDTDVSMICPQCRVVTPLLGGSKVSEIKIIDKEDIGGGHPIVTTVK